MYARTRIALALLPLLLLIATPSPGQVAFDREIRGVELVPDPASGQLAVRAYLLLSGSDDGGGPYDLSTDVELSVNGTPVASRSLSILTDPPSGPAPISCEVDCGPNCGSLYVDGVINTMLCHIDGIAPGPVVDCDCGYWINLDLGLGPIGDGDVVEVTVAPAPRAEPDASGDNKSWVYTWAGEPTGVSRKPREIVVVGSKVKAVVEVGMSTLQGTIDSSVELELLVNGAPVGARQLATLANVDNIDFCETAVNCGGGCGSIFHDGAINGMTCNLDGLLPGGDPDCNCGYWWTSDGWEPGTLLPGDQLTVKAHPAPGSLPVPGGVAGEHTMVYEGDRGWDRDISGVQLREEGGNRFLDVHVAIANSEVDQFRALGYELLLKVGGVTRASLQYDMNLLPQPPGGNCPQLGCSGSCQAFEGDNPFPPISSGCRPWGNSCWCTHELLNVFPIDPGDDGPWDVELHPLPGALPELPGFGDEEDEERFDPRATGTTGPATLLPTLHHNVPNPFNPRTTLSFTLPRAGSVRLEVLDIAGRRVRVLHRGLLPEGTHEFDWDGRDRTGRTVSSGSYFYRLESAGGSQTRRMVLAK